MTDRRFSSSFSPFCCSSSMVIDHINGELDNRACNLQQITQQENTKKGAGNKRGRTARKVEAICLNTGTKEQPSVQPRGGSGEGLLPLRKNRPQVSPACRKRRSKRGDSFAVSRDPCRWRKRSWCHEDIWVAGVSHLPNTALWLLLHLDGRLERARSNQSAGHAKP